VMPNWATHQVDAWTIFCCFSFLVSLGYHSAYRVLLPYRVSVSACASSSLILVIVCSDGRRLV
jgi:hypothetical protein